MKLPLYWIGILIVGMICKHSMTKYLLVEVDGPGGSNVPASSPDGPGGSSSLDVHEQCKGKKCGTRCVLPKRIEAACDVNERCDYAGEARKGCQDKKQHGTMNHNRDENDGKRKCGDTFDRCANKKCGESCAPTCGMLMVARFCQPDGSCDTSAAPKCGTQNIKI